MIDDQGRIYIGERKHNKANGTGKYVDKTFIYEGQWKDDFRDGMGVEVYPDGSKFQGKEGYGIFEWADNSFYAGNFQNGEINGFGVYQWPDKKKFEGFWMNNLMHGEGVFTWQDGRKYKGAYVQDKKEGYGELSWPDGKLFKGFWKNGVQHGDGELLDTVNKKV